MTRKILNIMICAFLLLSSAAVLAEKATIILKDGGRVNGNIETETPNTVSISNEYGTIEIEKANILRIERKSSSSLSYNDSAYSFKKLSWTKYAIFGSLAGGLIATGLTADIQNPAVTYWVAGGFSAITLGFIAADYFIYGRVPRERTRFSMFSPAPKRFRHQAALMAAQNDVFVSGTFGSLQSQNSPVGFSFKQSF